MADLSITPADVQAASGVTQKNGTAGASATIVAGQVVYADSTDSNYLKLADADAEASAVAVGIALGGASDGQKVFYMSEGEITVTSGVTVGTVYVASTTAGGLAPWADLGSGDYVTVIGIGKTATTIEVKINSSGVAIA